MSESFNKDEYLADLKRRQNLVTADEHGITIHGPADFDYDIALSRCSTPEKILQWVSHLSQKTWVTTEIIERFVAVASAKIGLDTDTVPA